MTAKQQALKDIKDDLKKSSRSFITYRSELNSAMRKIVSIYLKQQKEAKHG